MKNLKVAVHRSYIGGEEENSMIYLDYAATTPMSERALEAYRQTAVRFFGNSTSLHDDGSESNRALEGARKSIAGLLDLPDRGLRFTGSGSEANFLCLASLAFANRERGRHLITSSAEHSSVRNTFTWLEKNGFEVTRLGLDKTGRVEPGELAAALRDDTILVSLQHVNSEIGSIQPLAEVGRLLSGHQALLHSDMVQSFGKLEFSPGDAGIDSLTINAHKICGPKGIGAAWINPSLSWKPFIPEVMHEQGFRPGTVDVPGVVSFAVAAREAFEKRESALRKVHGLRSRLVAALSVRSNGLIVQEGVEEACSPYILGLSIPGMEGQFAMLECSQKGVAISTGSACQVNQQKPAATLLAMGRDPEEAVRFIRLSLDSATTEKEVDRSAEVLSGVIRSHLQKVSG